MDYDEYENQLDLEERLYAQLHHEAAPHDDQHDSTQGRSFGVSDNAPVRRYWNNEKGQPRPTKSRQKVTQERNFPPNVIHKREQQRKDRERREHQRADRRFAKQSVTPKFPKNNKRVLNPFSSKVKRGEKNKPKIDHVIVLEDDEDDGFKVPAPPPEKRTSEEGPDDDDVILIPAPPPVVVNLDDSDEETKVPSRTQSPSQSSNSMQSDDFIDRSDKNRVKSDWYFQDDRKQSNKRKRKEEPAAVDVSSSESEEFQEAYDEDHDQPSTSSMPIKRGVAVDNNYSRLKKQAQQQRSGNQQRKSFSTDNFTEDNFISVLTDIIRNESDSEDEEGERSQTPPGIDYTRPPPGVPEVRPVEMEDIQLNVTRAAPANIRDSMADDTPVDVVKIAEIGWNDEMRKYYYESWGGEKFNISSDAKEWSIDIEDRHPKPTPKMSSRCRNCQEFTHRVQNCPLPRKPMVCFMCGKDGHRESRCPDKLCLTCGATVLEFTRWCRRCAQDREKRCSQCQAKGHTFVRCPDKWRRYHSTVVDNVELNKEIVHNQRRWCSVCAREGHYAHNCHLAEKFFGTNLPKTNIISHTPIYPMQLEDEKPLVREEIKTAFSLMSYHKSFDFLWSPAVGKYPDSFYNRFRDSVGLEIPEPEVYAVDTDESDDCEVVNQTFESAEDRDERMNFSFTEELKKVNEERTFHLDIEQSGSSAGNYAPPVFTNFRDELERTAANFGVSPTELQLEAVQNLTFPGDAVEEQFISIADDEVMANLESDKIEAKVHLTPEHSKTLLAHGSLFIKDMSDKYDLDIRHVWESVGNMLVLYGTKQHQDWFYVEMKKFLDDSSKDDIRRRQLSTLNLPKHRDKIVKFVRERLNSLRDCTKSVHALKDLTKKLSSHMRARSYKAADKCRLQLNMHFLGRFGLGDGKLHILSIARQLDQMEKNRPGVNTFEFHNELQQHLCQIFTCVDHQNYPTLLNDLYACFREQKWNFTKDQICSISELIKLSQTDVLSSTKPKFYEDLRPNETEPRSPDSTTNDEATAVQEQTPKRDENRRNSTDHRRKSIENHSTPKPNESIERPPRVERPHENRDNQDLVETHRSTPHKNRRKSTENRSTSKPHDTTVKQETIHSSPVKSDERPAKRQKVDEPVVKVTPIPPCPKPADPEVVAVTSTNAAQNLVGNSFSHRGRQIIQQALSLFRMINNQNAVEKLNRVKEKADNNELTKEDYEALLQIQHIVHAKISENASSSS